MGEEGNVISEPIGSGQILKELWRRIEALEALVGGRGAFLYVPPEMGNVRYAGNLYAHRAGTYYDVYGYRPLTTKAESTSWDGDAKASGETIDLQTVFGLPAGIKAVDVFVIARDETVGVWFGVGPDSSNKFEQVTQVTDGWIGLSAVVPCDGNGDIYFSCSGELDSVYLYIFGYWL